MTNQTNQQTNNQVFFDLHIEGLGYISRIREVTFKKSSYWACDIYALNGSSEDCQTVRFDANIVGEEAIGLAKKLELKANNKDHKVLVGFKLGDLSPSTFEYKKGAKAGETGISLKCRLLQIKWIKIDGQQVWPPAAVASEAQAS